MLPELLLGTAVSSLEPRKRPACIHSSPNPESRDARAAAKPACDAAAFLVLALAHTPAYAAPLPFPFPPAGLAMHAVLTA